MKRKGFEDNTIRVVMEKLEDTAWQMISICQDWVRNRMHTGARSRVAIAYELRRKGIDGEIIDEAVGSITDEEEEKQALKIANKYYERYKGLEDEEIAVKIGQALARRGFGWDIIQRVIRRRM